MIYGLSLARIDRIILYLRHRLTLLNLTFHHGGHGERREIQNIKKAKRSLTTNFHEKTRIKFSH